MTANVFLIGFMATGKTAVGRALARKTKRKYVSVDTLVEKIARMKISSIFRKYGEERFRALESKTLKSAAAGKNKVISCGGGIILKSINRKILQKGFVVWLKAKPATIDKRLGRLRQRPLLDIKDKKARILKIKKLLSSRERFYRSSADLIIDTDGYPVSAVVTKISSSVF